MHQKQIGSTFKGARFVGGTTDSGQVGVSFARTETRRRPSMFCNECHSTPPCVFFGDLGAQFCVLFVGASTNERNIQRTLLGLFVFVPGVKFVRTETRRRPSMFYKECHSTPSCVFFGNGFDASNPYPF